MCLVKKEHNPVAICGGVALAVGVGGKFTDWFKILKGSKPMGDWHARLKTV